MLHRQLPLLILPLRSIIIQPKIQPLRLPHTSLRLLLLLHRKRQMLTNLLSLSEMSFPVIIGMYGSFSSLCIPLCIFHHSAIRRDPIWGANPKFEKCEKFFFFCGGSHGVPIFLRVVVYPTRSIELATTAAPGRASSFWFFPWHLLFLRHRVSGGTPGGLGARLLRFVLHCGFVFGVEDRILGCIDFDEKCLM